MTSESRKRSIFELIREYMRAIEEEIEERVREFFEERPSWNPRTCTLEPLCNVFVTPNEVIITADLPYAEENDIEVKPLNENLVEIKAKLKRKICFRDLGITHHKGEFSMFYCQVHIPVAVESNRRKVSFRNGILEVRLPRKRGYKIKIE